MNDEIDKAEVVLPIQTAINAAAEEARVKRINVAIPLSGSHVITDTLVIPPGVCIEATGVRGLSLLWNGGNDTTILKLQGGYGQVVKGIEVICRKPESRNLIGISIENSINGEYGPFRVDMAGGVDCIRVRS